MDTYYDSAMDDEGPIIQEIPDSLMVGDYIEIHGICRGSEVIIQLLSRNDPTAVPLHLTMSAGGPVVVKSQAKDKVEKQERNPRMCLQPNLDFVLCIYAMDDGYDIKLNQETLCFQKHVIKLEDVSAISMDGDADFTSIEFKDIYGDGEEENPYAREDPGQGLMRVQELRESFSRHRGSPMIVRSSIRKSNRSDRDPNSKKPNWPTSNDLSRADYDVDPVRDQNAVTTPALSNDVQTRPATVAVTPEAYVASPKPKSRFSWKPGNRKSFTIEDNKHLDETAGGSTNRILAGETHAGVYRSAEDGYATGSLGTLNASSVSLADKSKKKRTSLFGKLRKSKGSEADLSVEGSEKTKKKGLKNPFKSRKSVNVAPLSDNRQSYSMPDVTGLGSTYTRLSTDLDHSHLLGSATEPTPVRGPIPKGVQKSAAPEMAAYVVAQKAVPEFENFSLTNRDFRELPSLSFVAAPRTSHHTSVHSPSHERKLKGPAPEIADVLLDTERAGFDQGTALTSGQTNEPLPVFSRTSLYGQAEASHANKKFKGPAPEVAAAIDNNRYPGDTALTHETVLDHDFTSPHRVSAIPSESSRKSADIKLKGAAPEIAASLYERHSSSLNRLPDTTYTMSVAQSRQSYPTMERAIIDRDPVRIDSGYQSRPVHANRPGSAPHRRRSTDDSDASSVHSDGGYFLEVGKSDYYFDRRRSLHTYRSRKARKPQQDSIETSARSSVSSLKRDDKVIIPKRISDVDSRHQVSSWLNGYNREPEVRASRPNASKVYAAAPATKQLEPVQLSMKKDELKQADNVARIPLPLTPGRSAVLVGHFLEESAAQDNCVIRFKSTVDEESSGFDAVLFRLGINGEFSVQGSRNGETYTISEYAALDRQSLQTHSPEFTLEYYARSQYFAVTVNGFISFMLRGSFEPSLFQFVELLPGSNAELDYFSVASQLTLPIALKYPITSHREDSQRVTLNTRMDADTKGVRMEFTTQTNNRFDLVLDFIDGYVYAESTKTSDTSLPYPETARQSIPFVPEQIRKLVVLKKINDNTLTVFANQKEIFQQRIPLSKPYGKLSDVRVSGDILLLGIQFD